MDELCRVGVLCRGVTTDIFSINHLHVAYCIEKDSPIVLTGQRRLRAPASCICDARGLAKVDHSAGREIKQKITSPLTVTTSVTTYCLTDFLQESTSFLSSVVFHAEGPHPNCAYHFIDIRHNCSFSHKLITTDSTFSVKGDSWSLELLIA
jgi:hypothetical protein